MVTIHAGRKKLRTRLVEAVVRVCARLFKVECKTLYRRDRKGTGTVLARHMAMHLLIRELGMDARQVGRVFGGRDRSTALCSTRKVQDLAAVDKGFREKLAEAMSKVRGLDGKA